MQYINFTIHVCFTKNIVIKTGKKKKKRARTQDERITKLPYCIKKVYTGVVEKQKKQICMKLFYKRKKIVKEKEYRDEK